ncbi:MAG TPA: hypothetical protein VFY78_12095, partial [Gammaproteobacteria bacterium]|nr:hypothetical protein [Gammaproteobacteria bacterium]
IEQPAVIPAKADIQLLHYALAFAVVFKSVPISVASQSGFSQVKWPWVSSMAGLYQRSRIT